MGFITYMPLALLGEFMSTEKTAGEQPYSINNLPPFMQHWKDAVENGSTPEKIAENCYHPDAILKGTIADQAVQSTKAIEQYFHKFTAGKNEATVTFNTLSISPSGKTFSGEYTFAWTDDAGTAQEQKANYTFEGVGNDDGQTVIGVHHSSPI